MNDTAGGSGTPLSVKVMCSPFPSRKVRWGAKCTGGEADMASDIAVAPTTGRRGLVGGDGDAMCRGVVVSAPASLGGMVAAVVVVTAASVCERLDMVSVSSERFYSRR